jgi:hypothetical protein
MILNVVYTGKQRKLKLSIENYIAISASTLLNIVEKGSDTPKESLTATVFGMHWVKLATRMYDDF